MENISCVQPTVMTINKSVIWPITTYDMRIEWRVFAGFAEHIPTDVVGRRWRHQAATGGTNDSCEARGTESTRGTAEMEGKGEGTETTHL